MLVFLHNVNALHFPVTLDPSDDDFNIIIYSTLLKNLRNTFGNIIFSPIALRSVIVFLYVQSLLYFTETYFHVFISTNFV